MFDNGMLRICFEIRRGRQGGGKSNQNFYQTFVKFLTLMVKLPKLMTMTVVRISESPLLHWDSRVAWPWQNSNCDLSQKESLKCSWLNYTEVMFDILLSKSPVTHVVIMPTKRVKPHINHSYFAAQFIVCVWTIYSC